MGPNVVLALQILGSLLEQAIQVKAQIDAANAAGADLTLDQLNTMAAQAGVDLDQLQKDINSTRG